MEYINIKAPNRLSSYSKIDLARTVFLAGSISNAADWQKEATDLLLPHFNIFNPRRENFDKSSPEVEREQITWEYVHLDLAEITLFNFRYETVAPITLLEYGKQLVKAKYAPYRKTYVCVDPLYTRKNDIYIQTELVDPKLLKRVFSSLPEMCEAIIQENTL